MKLKDMKKVLLFVGLLVGLSTSAQNLKPCGEAEVRNDFLNNATPKDLNDYNQSRQQLEQFTQQYIQNHPELMQNDDGSRVISYTIPVVFHIIHTNGVENISDAQVYDAVEVLNRDYQLMNADANNVQPEFSGMPADIEVEFILAKKDNNGNCTKGITRTYSASSYSGGGQQQASAVYNAQGNWPGDKYLNIFVVGYANDAAGYTYKPSGWAGTNMDNGIYILHNYVGRIGTGSNQRCRSLTHEVGHWFNLDHLWGGSNNPGLASNCNDDDGVADTPNTEGWTSCTLNGTTCDGNKDNVENYMEYSYCSKMFTPGQKARMHAALNSGVGGRSNLWTTSNLTATGVSTPDVICEADFTADKFVICEGESIDFTDQSFHGPVSWDWNFNGGSPSVSTDQNPTITYNTAGEYSVTLFASDGTNSASETKTAYITVLPNTGASSPASEGFETATSLPTTLWYTDSPTNDWQLSNSAAASGAKSLKLNNFGSQAGTKHYLESSTIDMSGSGPIVLTFDFAYKKRSSGNNEYLRIYASNNCGDNWTVIKNIQGSSLGSTVQSTPFTPSEADWNYVVIDNIVSSYNVSNLRFRFEFSSDDGNNFWIDNINVAREALSTEELGNDIGLSIYPNPANNIMNVSFNVEEANKINMEVVDVAGRMVYNTNVNNTNGNITEQVDVTNFQSGIYLLNLTVDGQRVTKKFIVK